MKHIVFLLSLFVASIALANGISEFNLVTVSLHEVTMKSSNDLIGEKNQMAVRVIARVSHIIPEGKFAGMARDYYFPMGLYSIGTIQKGATKKIEMSFNIPFNDVYEVAKSKFDKPEEEWHVGISLVLEEVDKFSPNDKLYDLTKVFSDITIPTDYIREQGGTIEIVTDSGDILRYSFQIK